MTHVNTLCEVGSNVSYSGATHTPRPEPSAIAPTHAAPNLQFTTATNPSQAKEYFLGELSDVLVTKLDLKMKTLEMVGTQMNIHLREDVKLFAIHTPRLNLLAFWETVKAELDTMVAQGVITPGDGELLMKDDIPNRSTESVSADFFTFLLYLHRPVAVSWKNNSKNKKKNATHCSILKP